LLFKIGFIESASHNFRPFPFHLTPRGHVTYLTFPVRTAFKKSNISIGNAQANIDVSLAKTHCNAGVHKSVASGRYGE